MVLGLLSVGLLRRHALNRYFHFIGIQGSTHPALWYRALWYREYRDPSPCVMALLILVTVKLNFVPPASFSVPRNTKII